MKVHQIISENPEIDEAPVGMFKKGAQALGRYLGSKTAAGAEEVSDEANGLKKELARWMGQAGIKSGTLTVDQLEKFLAKAGYSGMAAAELEKLRTAKQQSSDARQKKIQNFGQRVGAGIAGAKAGVAAARSTYAQRAPQESVFEEAGAPLNNSEVDKVLLAVVKQAALNQGGAKRGKFAADPAPAKTAPGAGTGAPSEKKKKPKIPADVVSIISKLSPEEQQKIMQAITKKVG
jgi:hypothetical protein